MAKTIMLAIGLIILAIGIFLAWTWWTFLLQFLAAVLVVIFILLGLVVVILAIGEMSSRNK